MSKTLATLILEQMPLIQIIPQIFVVSLIGSRGRIQTRDLPDQSTNFGFV